MKTCDNCQYFKGFCMLGNNHSECKDRKLSFKIHQEKETNFECRYLSIGGYCMDKPDLNDWEECKGCDKTNKCEYCTWPSSQAGIVFCNDCKIAN